MRRTHRALAIVLASQVALRTDYARAGEPATEPASAPSEESSALTQLAAAQAARERGDLEAALAAADAAVADDPELAFAYLARAQIRLELVGDPGLAPSDPQDAKRRAELIDAAAQDLDRYLAHGAHDEAARTALAQQRDELWHRATQLRELASRPPAPAHVETAAPPIHVPPAKPARRPAAGALLASGVVLGAAAIPLAAASLRIEQRCTALCSASWGVRPALLAPAIVATSLSLALTVTGTRLAIRERSPKRERQRAAIGATLMVLGGGALAAGTTSLALAGRQWNEALPSDDAALARMQLRANAGLALLVAVPTLVGAATALLVRRARTPPALARR